MNHSGNGIGLSVCSKIATALGGTLTATSTYGEGSNFTLKISAQLVKPSDL
jgi:signal transduction histidine kinase